MAFGVHLYNTAPSDIRVYYWWDKRSREVDFVLQRGSHQVVAIEMKSGPKKGPLRGMEAFAQEFRSRLHGSLLVGDAGIPLNEFLTTPARQWFEEA